MDAGPQNIWSHKVTSRGGLAQGSIGKVTALDSSTAAVVAKKLRVRDFDAVLREECGEEEGVAEKMFELANASAVSFATPSGKVTIALCPINPSAVQSSIH